MDEWNDAQAIRKIAEAPLNCADCTMENLMQPCEACPNGETQRSMKKPGRLLTKQFGPKEEKRPKTNYPPKATT